MLGSDWGVGSDRKSLGIAAEASNPLLPPFDAMAGSIRRVLVAKEAELLPAGHAILWRRAQGGALPSRSDFTTGEVEPLAHKVPDSGFMPKASPLLLNSRKYGKRLPESQE